MTSIDCKDIDQLLMEGDAASLAIAEAHAAACNACAETLASWNDISATARSLRADWPSEMLWPRVERALERERRSAERPLWRFAAAAALSLAVAGGSWFALHQHQERVAFDHAILREQALEQVESAERAHVDAIERLEKIAAPTLAESDSPLMVSYKEKLMLLDDAIAECQSGIRQNRQNAHLRRQLLAVYSEKQTTLQDVLREERRDETTR